MKERNKLGKKLFGPRLGRNGEYISYKASVEYVLNQVDGWRTEELYRHDECTGETSGPWMDYGNWLMQFGN